MCPLLRNFSWFPHIFFSLLDAGMCNEVDYVKKTQHFRWVELEAYHLKGQDFRMLNWTTGYIYIYKTNYKCRLLHISFMIEHEAKPSAKSWKKHVITYLLHGRGSVQTFCFLRHEKYFFFNKNDFLFLPSPLFAS